ncbi:MAG: hypothetical protein R2700_07490 [Solirubrobacterales bacterium]
MAVSAALAPALAGCGAAEPQRAANPLVGPPATPVFTDADRVEIAALINEVNEAFAAGDGKTVCARLTQHGAATMSELDVVPLIEDEVEAHVEGEPLEPTCESAVASFTEGLSASERRTLQGPRPYRATDVDLEATVAGAGDGSGVQPAEGSPTVQVTCLENSGNYLWATHQVDGTWRLELPFCSGR